MPRPHGDGAHRRRAPATWSSCPSGARYRRARVPGPPHPRSIREQGDQFHLAPIPGDLIPVFGRQSRQPGKKRQPRAPFRRTLIRFHCLICGCSLTSACVKPDKANASALALCPGQWGPTTPKTPYGAGAGEPCPLAACLDSLARCRAGAAANHGTLATRLPFALGAAGKVPSLALDVPGADHGAGELIRYGTLRCFRSRCCLGQTAAAGA